MGSDLPMRRRGAVSVLTLVRAAALYSLPTGLDDITVREPCFTREDGFDRLVARREVALLDDDDGGDCAGDWTHGAVWRGGELLAHHVLAAGGAEVVRAKVVLELGSGTGIAGLAAAAAGAAAVVLSDAEPARAAESLARNPAYAPRVVASELRWGDAAQLRLSAALVGDANGGARASLFDVVLAADVVYPSASARVVEALLTTVRDALFGAHGVAMLCYVERSTNTTARLHEHLGALGCRCSRQQVARHVWIYKLDRWPTGAAEGNRPCVVVTA